MRLPLIFNLLMMFAFEGGVFRFTSVRRLGVLRSVAMEVRGDRGGGAYDSARVRRCIGTEAGTNRAIRKPGSEHSQSINVIRCTHIPHEQMQEKLCQNDYIHWL